MIKIHKRAFTLLELMIVVIIIGILASLAIPRFIVARDKAIKAEAWNMLGVLRGAQERYHLENDDEYAEDIADLDAGPPENPTRYFSYVGANDAAGSSYICGATGILAPVDDWAAWFEADGRSGQDTDLP